MSKFKKVVITIAAIFLALFIILIMFFGKDKYTLTARDIDYLEKNNSEGIDVSVIHDYPIYSGSDYIIERYLGFISKKTNIDIKASKTLDSKGPKYEIASLDINKKADKNEHVLATDYYSAIAKNDLGIKNINDFSGITMGIFTKDLDEISYYMSSIPNLIYKSFDNKEALFKALDDGQVKVVIAPHVMNVDQIIKKEYFINYSFKEMKRDLVLRGDKDNTRLNEILEKVTIDYKTNSFRKDYNQSLFNFYKETDKMSAQDASLLKSKSYKYGYVEEAPYEMKDGKRISGINYEYLKKMVSVTGVDLEYVKFDNYKDLKKAVEEKKIDVFYDYYNINNPHYLKVNKGYNTNYVVLSRVKDRRQINSLESLKGENVYTLKNRNLYFELKENEQIKVKAEDSLKKVRRKADKEEAIIIIDKVIYEYHKNSIFKNYFVLYEGNVNSEPMFMVKEDNKIFYNIFNFIVNNNNPYDTDNDGLRHVYLSVFKKNTFNQLYILLALAVIIPIITILIIEMHDRKKRIKNIIVKEDRHKYIDFLTSLKNRNYLNLNIPRWNELSVLPKAVIVIDLNMIKYINDKYGHLEGDREIIKAAEILIDTQLENSEIVRTDGNEFLIYLVGYNDNQVESYVKRLKKELGKLPHLFGASLGYSVINSEVKSIDDAINEASIMMRQDKENDEKSIKKD